MRLLVSGFCFAVIFILFAAPAWSWTQEEMSQFKKANAHYRQGQYSEAVPIYKELADKHPKAAVFHYNLGNAYFRLGKRGESLLSYERARLLAPRNRDIEANLNYVRGLLEYRIEDKRNWYVRAGEKFLEVFTEKEVNALCLVFYFLFLAGWGFILFFRRGTPWGWRRKTLFIFAVFSLFLVLAKKIDTTVMREAIVMSKEAEVRYGPSDNDQVAFRLGEGLKVYVVDHREDWSRVILVNGDGGWVQNNEIAEVR